MTQSSVTLSGSNSYTGNTFLNSGYLYVTNDNSLGSGAGQLIVPGNTVDGWSATLAATGSPVDLVNPIAVGGNGLALNTGSANTLTLSGNIHNHGSPGALGIFGPVVLSGNNTYSGGTDIQATTVTVDSNGGLGIGGVNANGSTLFFYGANPVLASQAGSQVYLTGDTAIFAGNPLINNLQMAESTLNLDGASATINGINDSPGSGDQINLTTGTVLTIDADGNGSNGGATFHGAIQGPGSLILTSSMGNSVDLRGANTYTGGTTITGGTAAIASNDSAFGTGPVTVNGGGVITNTGVTVTNPITLNGSVGNISGIGAWDVLARRLDGLPELRRHGPRQRRDRIGRQPDLRPDPRDDHDRRLDVGHARAHRRLLFLDHERRPGRRDRLRHGEHAGRGAQRHGDPREPV